jgi:hypothetical protein
MRAQRQFKPAPYSSRAESAATCAGMPPVTPTAPPLLPPLIMSLRGARARRRDLRKRELHRQRCCNGLQPPDGSGYEAHAPGTKGEHGARRQVTWLQQGYVANAGPSSSEILTVVHTLGKEPELLCVIALLMLSVCMAPLRLAEGGKQWLKDSAPLHLALWHI